MGGVGVERGRRSRELSALEKSRNVADHFLTGVTCASTGRDFLKVEPF